MSTKFHSPYQFVSLRPKQRGAGDLSYQDIQNGLTHVRHDRWQPGCNSGRLLCRLHTHSPTLVGNGQHERADGILEIEHYSLDGEPAMPANSLRGMVAAVAEAISNSAMRVLTRRDDSYSVRQDTTQALKAVGELRRVGDDWHILPLAMTGFCQSKRERPTPAWCQVFPKKLPKAEIFAFYFGHYLDPKTLGFTARFDCWRRGGRFLYSVAAAAQGGSDHVTPLTDLEHTKPGQPALRGVAYVLGRHSSERMPRKLHEWFVPYAEDWEERLKETRPDGQATLPIPDSVIADFNLLVRHAAAANKKETKAHDLLPHIPKGYGPRARDASLLRDGDLIHFDIDRHARVCAIGWSTLWRRRVRGTIDAAIARAGGDAALPWGRTERDWLTPAECLFGVIDERDHGMAKNLASRVRFSDARALAPVEPLYAEPQPLRQLQSPKPPSPAMYFRGKDGSAVRRGELDLGTDDSPVPNGRKHYLAPLPAANEEPWLSRKLDDIEEKDADEQTKERAAYAKDGGRYANPVQRGQDFWFHVDFDNLSDAEIGLLIAALEPRQSSLDLGQAGFRHRLGWGKPVGLGVVEVEIAGLFKVERAGRYSTVGLLAPRYAERKLAPSAEQARAALLERYADELAEQGAAPLGQLAADSSLLDPDAFAELCKIADPAAVQFDVTYPFVDGQDPHGETDGYKWFVSNEQNKTGPYQYLKPVDPGAKCLPALTVLPPPKKG
jgi:CRISPR-associated protein (TIGR03986 family)